MNLFLVCGTPRCLALIVVCSTAYPASISILVAAFQWAEFLNLGVLSYMIAVGRTLTAAAVAETTKSARGSCGSGFGFAADHGAQGVVIVMRSSGISLRRWFTVDSTSARSWRIGSACGCTREYAST